MKRVVGNAGGLRAVRYIMLVAVIALFAGCAAPPEKVWDLTWPSPPDPPKIKYVEIIQSDRDVEKASSIGETIFGETTEYKLTKPYGVAVDKDGRVFVTDAGFVAVFDKKGHKMGFLGAGGMGALDSSSGLAVSDRTGRTYVADNHKKLIMMYDSNFTFLRTIGQKDDFENPMGLAVDDERQRLYAVDSKKCRVKVFSLDGNPLFTFGKRGEADGEFNTPTHVAVDKAGDVYVVDTQNFRVQIFDPEGKFLSKFGELGDAVGQFARPKGIALDSDGNIYVVDAAYQNVQVFNKKGELLLFFGGQGSDPGQFFLPAGIAIDNEDRVYVTEQFTARVQVFQYMGKKWQQRQAAQ